MRDYSCVAIVGFLFIYLVLTYAVLEIIKIYEEITLFAFIILTLLASAYLFVVSMMVYKRTKQIHKHLGGKRG